jgi:hypothetical protein
MVAERGSKGGNGNCITTLFRRASFFPFPFSLFLFPFEFSCGGVQGRGMIRSILIVAKE